MNRNDAKQIANAIAGQIHDGGVDVWDVIEDNAPDHPAVMRATAPTVDDQFSAWSRIGHTADQPPSCETCRAEKRRLRECDERRRAGR